MTRYEECAKHERQSNNLTIIKKQRSPNRRKQLGIMETKDIGITLSKCHGRVMWNPALIKVIIPL